MELMQLSGEQRKRLRKAILSAYPNQDELVLFLCEEMDLNFDSIATGSNYSTRVFNLIRHLESAGRLKTFIDKVASSELSSGLFQEFIIQPQNDESLEYQSLAQYLKNHISPETEIITQKLRWQVLGNFLPNNSQQPINIQQLYVPLEVELLDSNGQKRQDIANKPIKEWVMESLQNTSNVLFVEGDPGRGKSIFCRIFANFVRENIESIRWIPILIRLRDIKDFDNLFEKTLQKAIDCEFSNNDRWLKRSDKRYIFILDGFDELILGRGQSLSIKQFLEQIVNFQNKCNDSVEMSKHRILITGRPLALQGIEHLLPRDLERSRITSFSDSQIEQWLDNWHNIIGSNTASVFREWLFQVCPPTIQNLAREPLLLALLAIMHLSPEPNLRCVFTDDSRNGLSIYEKFIDWVLRHRPETWTNNHKLHEIRKLILQEISLLVTQSKFGNTTYQSIEERLKLHKKKDMINTILIEESLSLEEVIRSSLVCFYFKSNNQGNLDKNGSIEFIHKSFSEFLFADKIKGECLDWSRKDESGVHIISEYEMYRRVYDLLGYGGLSTEIIGFLMGFLMRHEFHDNLIILFIRFRKFYLTWIRGEFDSKDEFEDFSQRKVETLKLYQVTLGRRQVDIYTGINILILLFKLNCYAQSDQSNDQSSLKKSINFHPCGEEGSEDFDRTRLLRVINYANSIKTSNFTELAGRFGSSVVTMLISK